MKKFGKKVFFYLKQNSLNIFSGPEMAKILKVSHYVQNGIQFLSRVCFWHKGGMTEFEKASPAVVERIVLISYVTYNFLAKIFAFP